MNTMAAARQLGSSAARQLGSSAGGSGYRHFFLRATVIRLGCSTAIAHGADTACMIDIVDRSHALLRRYIVFIYTESQYRTT
jgi:hypothetical protein